MKAITSAAVFILLIGTIFATMSCAQEPGAVAPPTTQTSAVSSAEAVAPKPAELLHALEKAQQAMQEQADAMRLMRQELDRQGKEIESLRQQRLGVAPGVPTLSDVDSGADAAQLKTAVLALRTPAASLAVAASIKPATPLPPGDLYFRLGHATFTPSGWIDFTGYYRSTDVGSGLGTNFQSIPFSNTVAGGLSETRLTAQSSRIGIKVDEALGKIKAYGYLEADFNGYLPGNAYVSTNSNTLRMRVYYLNLTRGKWEFLGGQGWSLLTPTRRALSPFLADLFNTFHLDTSYQTGLTYARQTQFRFVYHPTTYWAAGLSVEDPEQFSGSAVTFPTLFSNTETDINSSTGSGGATATPNFYPDVIAKTTLDCNVRGLHWHTGVAGLLTATRIDTPASVTKAISVHDARQGGAVVGDFNLELFKGFHLITIGYWSDGGGRYIGGMGPGFVVLQNGTVTSPFHAALIHSGSGIGGFEWSIDKRTTIASYVSGAYYQRRYGLDPDIKTATYVGYGFPGSASTNNRAIKEATFASISTLWQKPPYGALQIITQSSYVLRDPWYVAPGQPKDAHVFMEFVNLRYVLP
ncbi:MAG: hypothetical protein ABSF70_10130 [Terracidiphilus sp.]|jgi:hypothetical protein